MREGRQSKALNMKKKKALKTQSLPREVEQDRGKYATTTLYHKRMRLLSPDQLPKIQACHIHRNLLEEKMKQQKKRA